MAWVTEWVALVTLLIRCMDIVHLDMIRFTAGMDTDLVFMDTMRLGMVATDTADMVTDIIHGHIVHLLL